MAKKPEKKNSPTPDSRKQLLDLCLKLFAQKGYTATTIREIVDAAGTTAPTLLYYFGNKEGLYIELMKTQFAQFDAVMYRNSINASEKRQGGAQRTDRQDIPVRQGRSGFLSD